MASVLPHWPSSVGVHWPAFIHTCSLYLGGSPGISPGPLLFTIYTSPVSSIVSSYSVKQHQYADDTQLFIPLSPTGYSADISHLTKCLTTVHSWFCLNGMALNPDKSDAIIIGTHQRSPTPVSLQLTSPGLQYRWPTTSRSSALHWTRT